MKKFFVGLIVLCTVQGILNAKPDIRRIEKAIAESDVAQVKSLMRKFGREEMPLEERKLVYRNLLDQATETVVEKRSRIGLTESWKDLAQAVVGSAMVLLGVAIVSVGLNLAEEGDSSEWTREQRINDARFKRASAVGTLLCAAGGFLSYRGFSCKTQKGLLTQAEEVELFIENRLTELDEKDPEEK
jgi:hypothetical protein